MERDITLAAGNEILCSICDRVLGNINVQEHHLIPKTFKGKETIFIHKICHSKIHSTFSERELLQYYHIPERILEHEEMQKFVKWISKKPLEFYNKNDDSKQRKSKR